MPLSKQLLTRYVVTAHELNSVKLNCKPNATLKPPSAKSASFYSLVSKKALPTTPPLVGTAVVEVRKPSLKKSSFLLPQKT